jgi:hypothetical protein
MLVRYIFAVKWKGEVFFFFFVLWQDGIFGSIAASNCPCLHKCMGAMWNCGENNKLMIPNCTDADIH